VQESLAVGNPGAAGTVATGTFQISPQTLLIAMPDGRCWLLHLGSSEVAALPESAVAAERSTLAASAVEGAIAAGLAQGGHTPAAEPYTLLRYIRWLAGNYVFAGQTPGLFRRGAERFDATGRRDLAAFALQKAAEESGHAELAYRDLQSLGLPAAEVVRLVAPPSARAFAERFRTYVESSEPIALFGFSYCLERMAVERDHAFIRKVESICPPGSRALRFLKVHSNIGSDSSHVHEQLSVFESFTNVELTMVIRAAYETAKMLARQLLMDQALSDVEINRRLRLAGIEVPFPPTDTRKTRKAIAILRKGLGWCTARTPLGPARTGQSTRTRRRTEDSARGRD